MLGVERVFFQSCVTVLMAMFRSVRYGLQLFMLNRGEQSEDLLVRSLVLIFLLSAAGCLCLRQLRDFCLLLVRQLHRLNELKCLFEAMNKAS